MLIFIMCFKGDYMLDNLKKLCKQYSSLIMNARGLGTFLAIDGATPSIRDNLIVKLRNNGKYHFSFTNLSLYDLSFSMYF